MVLERTKKGKLTCRIEDKYLHSSYDPDREAERYLNNLKISKHEKLILFEPGLGYIIPLLENKLFSLDNLTIISVDLELQKERNKLYPNLIHVKKTDFYNFLNQTISEINCVCYRFISWPPSEKIFEQSFRETYLLFKNHINRCTQNKMNNIHMGKKRIRNSLRNIFINNQNHEIKNKGKDVLLVAPGPSIEENIQLIKEYAGRVPIVALPSSVRFLVENNIKIDWILCSDPGYWASIHYRYFPKDAIVLSPIDAEKNLIHLTNKQVFIKTDNPFSHFLDTKCFTEGISVAILAINILLHFFKGTIYLFGMDLSHRDIQQHCRPHSFDEILSIDTNRLTPGINTYYNRYILSTIGGKGPLFWFRKAVEDLVNIWGDRIQSITENPLEGIGLKRNLIPDQKNPLPVLECSSVELDKTTLLNQLKKHIQSMLSKSRMFPEKDPFCYLFYQYEPSFFIENSYDKKRMLEKLDNWIQELKDFLDAI